MFYRDPIRTPALSPDEYTRYGSLERAGKMLVLVIVLCGICSANAQTEQTFPNGVSFFGQAAFNKPLNYNVVNSADSVRVKQIPVLSHGISYFVQGGYNRPFDSETSYDRISEKLRYKTSASLGIGINGVKTKIAYSALLKYTYLEGTEDYSTQFHSGSSGFKSHFYVGKISEELMVHRITGRRRRLFLGTGLFVGENIFINNAGYSWDYGYSSTYPYYTYTTRKLTARDFGRLNLGLIFDVKYSLQYHSRPNSCFILGSRLMTGMSAPYPYGSFGIGILSQQEVEIYVSYNFWGTRKSKTTGSIKEPFDPDTENGNR